MKEEKVKVTHTAHTLTKTHIHTSFCGVPRLLRYLLYFNEFSLNLIYINNRYRYIVLPAVKMFQFIQNPNFIVAVL